MEDLVLYTVLVSIGSTVVINGISVDDIGVVSSLTVIVLPSVVPDKVVQLLVVEDTFSVVGINASVVVDTLSVARAVVKEAVVHASPIQAS